MLPLRLGRCPTTNNRDTPNDINYFHVAHARAHEGALRKTAKQMGVTLVAKMKECKGWSLAKGIRISIPSKTSNRAVKRLFRVFGGFWRQEGREVDWGKKHPMTIRDDYSRYIWMCFISHKPDAADTFANFMSDLR